GIGGRSASWADHYGRSTVAVASRYLAAEAHSVHHPPWLALRGRHHEEAAPARYRLDRARGGVLLRRRQPEPQWVDGRLPGRPHHGGAGRAPPGRSRVGRAEA